MNWKDPYYRKTDDRRFRLRLYKLQHFYQTPHSNKFHDTMSSFYVWHVFGILLKNYTEKSDALGISMLNFTHLYTTFDVVFCKIHGQYYK